MSRYSDFEEGNSSQESIRDHEPTEDEPVCIKNLISQPNPLMDKVEFTPFEAKSYYPSPMTKLPTALSQQEYHIDRNNMILIDESLFAH